MKKPRGKKIFKCYGFDVKLDPKESFSFHSAGGIFLLHFKHNYGGGETILRRLLIDDSGNTVEFNSQTLNKVEKELYIKRLKRLNVRNKDIAYLLGIPSNYVSKITIR